MNENEARHDERRLDLSTRAARRDAADALPALMFASALGSRDASLLGGQIIGAQIVEALQPSIDALARLSFTPSAGASAREEIR